MTSPTGASFVDFFILEAGEYVEQLDALLLRATPAGPDAESLQKVARALRGSATMAKLSSFASLAEAVEGVGRSLRQGGLAWDQALKGAMTAAVDDLKLLVRAARAWSATEDQWAAKRIAELARYAPLGMGSGTGSGRSMTEASGAFFGSEATTIAQALEELASHPSDQDRATELLRRVRALRGVAGVRDIAALSEVAEAAESALGPVESGEPLSPERVAMLRASADLLRAIAESIQSRIPVTTATPAYRAYLSALDAMLANNGGAGRVIPITELFYDDGGPHIVETAPNPPTTPGQRFKMEVVSLGEHLHRVIDEARNAIDEIQREHARGELGRALRAIRATAAGFGQMAVAQTVEGHLERFGDLTAAALDGISQFAASISPAPHVPPPVPQHSVPFRMTHAREAVASLGTEPQRAAPTAAPSVPVPPRAPAPPRPPAAAPVASPAPKPVPKPSVPSMDDAIAAFDSLSAERFAEPVNLTDDVVPMDALLYRGQSAVARALELRDMIRQAGGPPSPDLLEEIFDLLELARVPEPAF